MLNDTPDRSTVDVLSERRALDPKRRPAVRSIAASAALALVLVVSLVVRAVVAARQAEQRRTTVVAERVFDELERSLDGWLEAEERRPFLHWNNQFAVDNDQGLLASKTSPLSARPADTAVVGYFQMDPSGRLLTPYRTPDGSAAVPDVDTIEAEITEALGRGDSDEQLAMDNPQQAAPPILQQLNKGLQQRSRAPQAQLAKGQQIGNFLDLGAPGAGAGDNREQAVLIEPFTVRTSDRWLVFERELHVDGSPWTQGLVVRREPFLAHIAGAALGELPGAELSWGSTSAPFVHRFREPFDALTVGLTLAPLPGMSAASISALLGVVLVLVLFGMAWLVWRWLEASAELARQRTDFVAAVTHELRSPLTSIRMYAEMLESDMAPPDARPAYLATIRQEAERLGTLVEGVLTFARLERGVRDESTERPLQDVVDEVVRVLEPVAAQRQLAVVLELGDAATESVPEQPVHQILHNLLDNAIKFGVPPGRVLVHARLGDRLRIEVHNPGPPLAPGLARSMFEPFVRGERELTRSTRGTGIGLAIVRGLADELGGSVGATDSTDGVVVSVELPRR